MLLEPVEEARPPATEDLVVVEAMGDDPNDPVLSVEEAEWKLELARPARLVQVGWMVSGEAIIGNHAGAQVVIPEVRAFKEQAFLTLDYFRLALRGRKGRIELLQEGDATLAVKGESRIFTEDVDNSELVIVRRDANLEPDFDVTLHVRRDDTLPDPRAQLIEVDTKDRLVAALFTLGFPLRADRRLRLGKLVGTYRYTGTVLQISDYLATYRTEDGFLPCFFRTKGRGWQTFPEDGGTIEIGPEDGLLVGNAVYRFTAG
jgi:hypothetical protein